MENVMTKIARCFTFALGSMSAAVAMAVSSPPANAAVNGAEWCAVYRGGSENCGFYNQAQCVANVSGTGGFCRMIFSEPRQSRRNG